LLTSLQSQTQYLSLLFQALWTFISTKEENPTNFPNYGYPAKLQKTDWTESTDSDAGEKPRRGGDWGALESTDDDTDRPSSVKLNWGWIQDSLHDNLRERLFCTSVKFLEIKKAKMKAIIERELKKYVVVLKTGNS
jgi:hypothetical protein